MQRRTTPVATLVAFQVDVRLENPAPLENIAAWSLHESQLFSLIRRTMPVDSVRVTPVMVEVGSGVGSLKESEPSRRVVKVAICWVGAAVTAKVSVVALSSPAMVHEVVCEVQVAPPGVAVAV